jgi:hypothetical protein
MIQKISQRKRYIAAWEGSIVPWNHYCPGITEWESIWRAVNPRAHPYCSVQLYWASLYSFIGWLPTWFSLQHPNSTETPSAEGEDTTNNKFLSLGKFQGFRLPHSPKPRCLLSKATSFLPSWTRWKIESYKEYYFKKVREAGRAMAIILATQEAEIRRTAVRSQPRQIVCDSLSWKIPWQKKGRWSGSRCRPEYKP